ncbi:UNVERIFIED_CONTAM: Zn/Cd-binding protein ZinT [Paenibacillus sp. PvR008]
MNNVESSIASETKIDLENGIVDERTEQELRQVDYDDLFKTVGTNLGLVDIQKSSGEVSTQGWRTKAAKEVALKLISKLKNIGSRAYNEQIRIYVDKIPFLTDGAKETLKYYLGYQVLMQALDIMVDFSGTAEDGIAYGLKYVGLPWWLAEPASRAIVFFLL